MNLISNIIDLEQYLPKPSSAEFLRREIVVAERISGDPDKLVGQTIKKASDLATQASVSEVEIFTRSGISTYFKLGLFVGFDDIFDSVSILQCISSIELQINWILINQTS